MPPNEFERYQYDDFSHAPHAFSDYYYRPDAEAVRELAKDCLRAWRYDLDVYRLAEGTNFESSRIRGLVNCAGSARLDAIEIPLENSNVTRAPVVTDLTEIIAVRLLKSERADIELPHPRVMHKETGPGRPLQHHGIDAVGFVLSDDDVRLVVVEVMASVQRRHPPSTVTAHRRQLLDDTLKEQPPLRLLEELEWLHRECKSEDEAEIIHAINSLLMAVADDSLSSNAVVEAVPVLLRPEGLADERDMEPFSGDPSDFERAAIPAVLWSATVECDARFTDLLRRVLDAAQGTP